MGQFSVCFFSQSASRIEIKGHLHIYTPINFVKFVYLPKLCLKSIVHCAINTNTLDKYVIF